MTHEQPVPSAEERQQAREIAQRQRAAALFAKWDQQDAKRAKRQAEEEAAWYRDYLWSEYPALGFTG
jgi:hypothetical protein